MLKSLLKRGVLQSGILRMRANRLPRSVVVLRYHSVQDAPEKFRYSIGRGIIHAAAEFERHMRYLAEKCCVVSMDEVADFVAARRDVPNRAVAITFDDGFSDNLTTAAPIMERYGVRGAIYVISGYVAGLPWYCRVRYAFFTSNRESAVNPFDGTVLKLEPYEERYKSFLICSRQCAKLAAPELQRRVSEIEEAVDVKLEPDTPIMLDWAGVKELTTRGHIVGSHTVWHPNVAQIPAEDARQELTASRAALSEALGKPVPHFSYPSPILEPHWTEQTVRISAEAGYQTAVTCTRGSVKAGDNPLSLKRMAVPEPFPDFVWALENQFAGRHT